MKRKKHLLAIALCAGLLLSGCKEQHVGKDTTNHKKEYSQELFAMDTYMTLTAYGVNAEEAVKEGIEEIERLDALWSISSEEGEIAAINKNGRGSVSADTREVLERAGEIYKSTDGRFDITVYPLMELWGFTSGEYYVPTKEEKEKALKLVDQSKVKLEEDQVILGEEQRMDLGAIAKGYTSQKIMELWQERGVTTGMVSLGGNVQTLGSKVDGSPWNIGIRDPQNKEGEMLGVVSVKDKAVITSGGYERYFEQDGKYYHHILDTTTGAPAENGLLSVSIISSDGTLADALSTSLFCMGTEEAIAYWKKHAEAFDMVLVNEAGEIFVTKGLQDSFITERAYEIAE